jgi:hypothetical protein
MPRQGEQAPGVINCGRLKHGQGRLCWLSQHGQSPTPEEYVSPKAWSRSLWASKVVCKIALPRVFDLTNRVCRGPVCRAYQSPGTRLKQSTYPKRRTDAVHLPVVVLMALSN